MHKKVGSETNPEADSKANRDVSGAEYNEYNEAETVRKLDGKMMNNPYDYLILSDVCHYVWLQISSPY